MELNMGPHHPSTHGVLRVRLKLDGEIVRDADADIGYLHTGFEKSFEDKTYTQGITFSDRMDYLAPPINNVGFVSAVEKLIGVEVALRASGVNYDVRKAFPYCGYEQYDFEVPVGTNGDCYDRYRMRVAEMRQSLRILQQAVDNLPGGPWITSDRKVALPPRSELSKSMEAVIHQFRLVSEGFKGPVGDVYAFVESPRGELGFYLVSDGTNKPYRMKVRPPSFCNLQALKKLVQGVLVADVIAIMGSLDFILGDCDR